MRCRGFHGLCLDAALARCRGQRPAYSCLSVRPLEPASLESATLLGESQERLCAARRETGWGPGGRVTGVPHQTVWKVYAGTAARAALSDSLCTHGARRSVMSDPFASMPEIP